MKITISADDMLKGTAIAHGWYKAEITETAEKPSKDGNSLNRIATFRLTHTADGVPLQDARTVDVYYNSQAIGVIKPLLAAISGLSEAEFIAQNKAGIEFDFENLKGKKAQVKIGSEMGKDNKLYENKVLGYAPYDYKIPF